MKSSPIRKTIAKATSSGRPTADRSLGGRFFEHRLLLFLKNRVQPRRIDHAGRDAVHAQWLEFD
jgi:hypothetical protein